MTEREYLKGKNRIVIKIGSSSLTHPETGDLNLGKIEKLVRAISDLKGKGKDVVLVSSGAIAAGRQALNHSQKPDTVAKKQAFAAVGQARLMMVYQRMFAEYNQVAAQILMTKSTMLNDVARNNAKNTFEELLKLHTVPIVNENDTVSTSEIRFGDNDRLSATVAALIQADLLILLSDIDGLYSDDPRKNPDAKFIALVPEITDELLLMGKGAGSDVGTGGMAAKLAAAQIATDSGSDMIIANGEEIDVLPEILDGKERGTLFLAHKNVNFDLVEYINAFHAEMND
ncbi:MAG: glutamate 5-kinase [bacterium]|nr:glutamate 5-kinase [bacterium]